MSDNLRTVQLQMLELLRYVDDVCVDNDLDYWIDGGTLLGAVRDSTFIPWDDDLDICLMKEDFDTLVDILHQRRNDSGYSLFYHKNKTANSWSDHLYCSKVLIGKKGLLKPVRIDITPMKLVKNTNADIREDLFITDVVNYLVTGNAKYCKELSVLSACFDYRWLLSCKKMFFEYFNNVHVTRNISAFGDDGLLIGYAYGDSLVCRSRSFFKYEDIFPLEKISFEGDFFSCPRNPQKYLSVLYGDYKKIPSLDRQKPANSVCVTSPSVDEVTKHLKNYIHKSDCLFLFSDSGSIFRNFYVYLRLFGPASSFLQTIRRVKYYLVATLKLDRNND